MFTKIIAPLFGIIFTVSYIILGILFIEFKIKTVELVYYIILSAYFIFCTTLLLTNKRKQKHRNICDKQENEYISYQISYPEYQSVPEPSAPIVY